MATYINTNVLLKPQDIFETDTGETARKKYAWLLLGSPTKNVALGSGGDAKSYYPLATEWKVQNGKMTFKNGNVCGIASVSKVPDYSLLGANEGSGNDAQVAESVVYNFPGNTSGADNLLYPIVPDGGDSDDVDGVSNTEGFSLNSGYLALVKLVSKYTSYDDFKTYYASLWGAPQGNGSIGGTFSQMSAINANGSEIAGYVKVLVAYDVTNQSMVNQYNFTGFNVGSSSLTISGLSSGN